ncbi:twin-arginine translocase subunit TatC [Cohnella soli]|uniref:Sec-independent protein translocase protein TatC n=1 Tax=Cohnella soli TaxID=425005 RepID=A0ABW0HR88_9BACL
MSASDLTLVDHLRELRMRVVRVAFVLTGALAAGLALAVPVVSYLKKLPPADGLEWHALSPWDGIRVYMQFALLFAVTATTPFILYQLWQFAKPGLTETEKRATLKYIPWSALLAALGGGFAYFLVFPFSVAFLTSLNVKMGLQETYGVLQYFSFMFNLILPCMLLFQMPVVIAFLSALGIVTPELLKKCRRYAYFTMAVVSTMIAPPDLISNLLVLAPFLVLFEISIWMSSAARNRKHLPTGGNTHGTLG